MQETRKYDLTKTQQKQLSLTKVANGLYMDAMSGKDPIVREGVEKYFDYYITKTSDKHNDLVDLMKDGGKAEDWNFIMRTYNSAELLAKYMLNPQTDRLEKPDKDTAIFQEMKKDISIISTNICFILSEVLGRSHANLLIYDKKENLFIISDSSSAEFSRKNKVLRQHIVNFCKEKNITLIEIKGRQASHQGCMEDSMIFSRKYFQHHAEMMDCIKVLIDKPTYTDDKVLCLDFLPPEFYKRIEKNEMREKTELYAASLGKSSIIEEAKEKIRNPKERYNLTDERSDSFIKKICELENKDKLNILEGEKTKEDVLQRKNIIQKHAKRELGIRKSNNNSQQR